MRAVSRVGRTTLLLLTQLINHLTIPSKHFVLVGIPNGSPLCHSRGLGPITANTKAVVTSRRLESHADRFIGARHSDSTRPVRPVGSALLGKIPRRCVGRRIGTIVCVRACSIVANVVSGVGAATVAGVGAGIVSAR